MSFSANYPHQWPAPAHCWSSMKHRVEFPAFPCLAHIVEYSLLLQIQKLCHLNEHESIKDYNSRKIEYLLCRIVFSSQERSGFAPASMAMKKTSCLKVGHLNHFVTQPSTIFWPCKWCPGGALHDQVGNPGLQDTRFYTVLDDLVASKSSPSPASGMMQSAVSTSWLTMSISPLNFSCLPRFLEGH